jgi:hypothetical protein
MSAIYRRIVALPRPVAQATFSNVDWPDGARSGSVQGFIVDEPTGTSLFESINAD